MGQEGWYLDPYGRHGERWFSDGRPTSLVRDGGVESREDPPPGGFEGPLVESVGEPLPRGSGLKRADDAQTGPSYDSERAMEAAEDAVTIVAGAD